MTNRVKTTSPAAERRLDRLQRLGYTLDNSIRVPGINYRIGYDALIGLIPGVGDLIGVTLSLYIVLEASRLGLPKSTIARMLTNVGIEAVVGTIPLLGDLFDATWKANARNLALIDDQLSLDHRGVTWSNRRFWFTIVLVFLLLVAVVVALIVLVVNAIMALV